jgi:hypothetical protein
LKEKARSAEKTGVEAPVKKGIEKCARTLKARTISAAMLPTLRRTFQPV